MSWSRPYFADVFKRKVVSLLQWSQMTTDQQKEYTNKVLCMKPGNLGSLELQQASSQASRKSVRFPQQM